MTYTPTANDQFATTASINSSGSGDPINADITLKLKRGGTVQDSEASATGPAGAWNFDFEPPTNGWPTATNYTVETWYQGVKVTNSDSFSVVDNGM